MGLPNEVVSGLLSSSGDNDLYQVSRSLRFKSGSSTYLSRTFSSTGNRQKFTFSCWIKKTTLLETEEKIIFSAQPTNYAYIAFGDSTYTGVIDGFVMRDSGIGSSATYWRVSNAVYRDPGAWFHLVLAYDTTNATAQNRIRVYVNGIEITSWNQNNTVTQNSNSNFNVNVLHTIGAPSWSTGSYINAYIAQVHFIDGQQLDPTSFAQSDTNGRWVPKAYTGTYGTNGFYLNFSDNSGTTSTTLGKDSSGNGNNWTPNNLSVTAGVGNDSLTDTPTNYGTDTGLGGEVRGNYATLNPVFVGGSNGQSINGNLQHYMPINNLGNVSTIALPDTGKWYSEFTCQTTSAGGIEVYVGVNTEAANLTDANRGGRNTGWVYYNGTGQKYLDGTASNYGTSYTTNDVIGIAVDKDNGTLTFYKNGVSQGAISSLPSTKIYFWSGSGGSTGYTAGYWNFGQRPFSYTAPTGFKALCTTNLPTPTIKNPTQYMNAITYTGTGATRSLTGVGFTPDLVWTKSRSNIESHKWTDSVRGTSKSLISDTTGDEVSESGVTSFNADGFTIGSATTGYNTNTYTYVGWNWKKGVTPGFDIVTYTGNGSNRTISHSIGAVPHFMIVKARTTAGTDQGWAVYHRNLTSAAYYKRLDGDPAGSQTSDATVWNSTAPTSSVFSVGTSALTNTNNDTYVAYIFTEIAGFSRFGSYVGNSSTDGPFVWCGFRPKYILCMNTGSTGYAIFDSIREPYNLMQYALPAGQNAAEPSAGGRGAVDFLSNGFKIRTTDGAINAGSTYIFAAFSEAPFKYSRGR